MDVLAGALAKAAGFQPGEIAAEYYESESSGITRLQAKTPLVAMVPLPFFLAHETDLKLTPKAQAVEKDGQALVTWTLVAKKGRVTGPSSLAGFNIVSLAGYAPDFIRSVALGKWGKLPADVTFTSSSQVLSALRKVSAGDNVAVLLDPAQAASVASLPFAAELEVVTTSPPVPGVVVCRVATAAKQADVDKLALGLLKAHQVEGGAAALDAVRLSKFVPLDAPALAAARASYRPAVAAKAR
jgi:hypothetical protein